MVKQIQTKTNKQNLQCNSPHTHKKKKRRGGSGKDVLGTVCLFHPYYTFFAHKGICALTREDMKCTPKGEKQLEVIIAVQVYILCENFINSLQYIV